jgi:hypothetical protein
MPEIELQMIEKQQATVWYAPTRKRRYLSKSGAIKGEATALILKRYPVEPYEKDTGAGFDIRHNEPKRFEKMHRRMCRIIGNAI